MEEMDVVQARIENNELSKTRHQDIQFQNLHRIWRCLRIVPSHYSLDLYSYVQYAFRSWCTSSKFDVPIHQAYYEQEPMLKNLYESENLGQNNIIKFYLYNRPTQYDDMYFSWKKNCTWLDQQMS